jgi:hypothetical protein
MIGLAQGTLQSLADQPLGVLAPFDLIFDQVTDELSSADYLGTTGVKLIRESDERIPDTPVPPSRVLKVLWLISRVEWVPRTPEVLARLLANQIDADLGFETTSWRPWIGSRELASSVATKPPGSIGTGTKRNGGSRRISSPSSKTSEQALALRNAGRRIS